MKIGSRERYGDSGDGSVKNEERSLKVVERDMEIPLREVER